MIQLTLSQEPTDTLYCSRVPWYHGIAAAAVGMAAVVDVAEVGFAAVRMAAAAVAKTKAAGAVSSRTFS
jgi:hypothetical protein